MGWLLRKIPHPPPPSPHSALPQEGAPPCGPGLAGILPQTSVGEEKKEEKVDYLNLLCPVPFEEIQREALMSLKPKLFEGLRFDFTKGLNQKFSLSNR
ncbi:mitochondrial import receptor subunit TOM40-1-like [Zea mays]|uniref:mitochondrial import receptor subunit TOM40-1-like n=1 Tax=Zea mays TaxID=4577 RepID=UPI0004DE9A6A|nr:mitochondrial import receptor subunit TOM40-1-like [Zea mays]|eukprot:XP_008680170.1 mitochondrial import receptor subunit TOM40-1-like [Zea mays]